MDDLLSDTWQYLSTVIIMTLAGVAFAARNFYQIRGDSPRWHYWQGVVTVLIFLNIALYDIWIGMAAAFIYWAAFDVVIARLLTDDWFYLGTTSFQDKLLNKLFGNIAGELFFILKILLFAGFTAIYFVTNGGKL